MKPGTQKALKHLVPAKLDTEIQGDLDETRWCFSFRARAKRYPLVTSPTLPTAPPLPSSPELALTGAPVEPSAPALSLLSPSSSSVDAAPVLSLLPNTTAGILNPESSGKEKSAVSKHICLLAGDSFAQRLDKIKLGRKSVVVESVARGGARIHQVMGQIRTYHEANKCVIVDKLFISVGTNDIRYCKDGVKHLTGKFKSLCSMIQELFPDSKVYFQSLIPLPCIHEGDWITNSNVIDFNSIIYNECKYRRFYILDAFSAFRDPFRIKFAPYPELRNNMLFVGKDIHPSSRRGMGVLAKIYLRAIHSRYFDPFVWQ